MPAPPPFYNAAPPAEPLSSFITRELGQQVPAAAAPVQEAAVVAARAYAGPDPVLHAGYDAAARSRVARRAALLGNQMVPGALVLLRLRRHDTAPDYHSPSVCIGILPVGYDHAASLAVAGGITFDVLFTRTSKAAWRPDQAFPQITAPLSSVLVSGITLTPSARKLAAASSKRIAEQADPQELGVPTSFF